MMRNRILFISTLLIAIVIGGCGEVEEEQQKAVEGQEITLDESCLYSYNADSSSVKWTAFKTTDRVAVGGQFDSVIVSLPDTIYSPLEALEKVSFRIISSSVFTDNSIRDATLRKYFFSTLKNDGNIVGNVRIVEGDEQVGGGTIVINLNDVKRDIGFKYSIEGDIITIKTKITLNSFKGEDAVQSLNAQCDDLHKGEDGISKLWPDLEIEVKAALKKQC